MRDEATGCLVWTGQTNYGYGIMWADGRGQRVHRLAWEWAHGPIPDGLVIDHLCMNRACVNVDHLEAVTQEVNAQRRSRAAIEGRGGGCPNGHSVTEIRVVAYPYATVRYCLSCHRERAEAKRRAEGRPIHVPADQRTTCKYGHPWPERMGFNSSNGRAHCLECRRLREYARTHQSL